MKISLSAAFGWLIVTIALLSPGVGRAELQRVEAVGIYGIRAGMRSRVIPRDQAIAKARWEGVSRVALELIGEAAPSDVDEVAEGDIGSNPQMGRQAPGESEEPSLDELEALRAALGKDVLPYMRSYRILDDRGEVPVLFNDQPDVTMEYVVVVEVIVDVDRVNSALASAGLIVMQESNPARESVLVEVVGLARYEAVEMLLGLLRDQYGATQIRLLEFSRERQLLAVEGPLGPGELSRGLARQADPRLMLEPNGVDSRGRRIRLIGRWFPDSED